MKKIILTIVAAWVLLSTALFFLLTSTDWSALANGVGQIAGDVANGYKDATK